MKEDERDAAFIATARGLLEERVQDLEPRILSRLRKARQLAIETTNQPIPWVLPATGIAATCALLAFFLLVKEPSLLINEPAQKEVFSGIEDLDLLAAQESLDFYEDLAFYRWLEAGDIES